MNKGYVYLLSEWGNELRYKIGITKNDVNKRIKQLKTGNSNDIKLIHYYKSKHYKKMEKMLHMKYTTTRLEGEWFILTDLEVAEFLSFCEELDDNYSFLDNNKIS